MYFAEVRHFEEIFRQGEQPSAPPQRTSKMSRVAATPSRPSNWQSFRKRSSMAPGRSAAARPAPSPRTSSSPTPRSCASRRNRLSRGRRLSGGVCRTRPQMRAWKAP
jgi:hypothetical protein